MHGSVLDPGVKYVIKDIIRIIEKTGRLGKTIESMVSVPNLNTVVHKKIPLFLGNT